MNARIPTPSLSAALACAACLAAALPRSASAESGPQYRDNQSQALGRTGVASSEGAASLFLNPAALGRATRFGAGLSADMGLNGVLIDYAEWAKDNMGNLDDNEALVENMGPVDNKWAPFSNSFVFSGNWGPTAVAAVIDARYELAVVKAPLTPVIGVGGLSDLILTAGRGFAFDGGYRAGFSLKYLYRLRYEDRLVGTTDEDFYRAVSILRKRSSGWMGDVSKVRVASELAEEEYGYGANFGAEKDFGKSWTIGASLLDFPTLIDQRLARADFDLGVSWHPDWALLPDLDDRLAVNLDWQRVLDPSTPWFRQIKAGAMWEGRMHGRPVSYIGVGLNDGYPTFGFRAGYLVYLSYVYTAEEAGTYPGQRKLSFHKIVVQAGF